MDRNGTAMKKAPLIRFLGSIRLAIPLLGAIAATLIGATIYEARVGSTIVQQSIYKSPWFGALMFLLAANLFASALSRYPWRGARKIGFALAHLGLVVLIAGSAAVIHLGVEGMLLVRTDSGSNDLIRLEGNLLEVMTADGTTVRADLFERDDGSPNPVRAGGLEVIGYSPNAVQTARFAPDGEIANPAVHLSLRSDRMGQAVDRWLAAAPVTYREISLGPASLALIPVATEAELQQYLAPPSPRTETGPMGALQIGDRRLDVTDLGSDSVAIGELNLQVEDFWPDFRLDGNNRPTSASEAPNNPAVQLRIDTPTGTERWFLFASGDFPPIRTVTAGDRFADLAIDYEFSRPEDYLEILVAPDGELFYAANSSNGHRSGPLAFGEAIGLGWADFKLQVEEFFPAARLEREIVPAEGEGGSPALLVQAPTGDRTWLPWNEPTTIPTDAGEIYAAFSPKLLQLPFGVALEDFIVERNEGSESVAMWTSKIRLENPRRGEVLQRQVWMNHPTWYRGWKLAQASWNPGDLSQSTLQVKREPAWVTTLTFSGAALVVLGVATLFYGRSLARQFAFLQVPTSVEAPEAPEASKPEAPESGVALGK